MSRRPHEGPNPKRVKAGRINQRKRKGLTEIGRARLRAAAMEHRPWQFATGPRTPQGKARAAANGKLNCRKAGLQELQADLAAVKGLVGRLQTIRREVSGG